jgi:hypothetical protein
VAGSDVRENLAAVARRMQAAMARAGRAPGSVRLIAVTKTFGPAAIREAVAAGQRDLGENRLQESLEKMEALTDVDLTWHLIGHLQMNKAAKAARAFTWIHSIDSRDLLARVDRASAEGGRRTLALIQVDLAHEATKSGADERDVADLVKAALDSRATDLRGLMMVPPLARTPDDARPWFRRLRDLRDRLVAAGTPADRLRELSMGMSHDFEVAIEEGATMVRIGTAIFGGR